MINWTQYLIETEILTTYNALIYEALQKCRTIFWFPTFHQTIIRSQLIMWIAFQLKSKIPENDSTFFRQHPNYH